jgi:hypothetical protein
MTSSQLVTYLVNNGPYQFELVACNFKGLLIIMMLINKGIMNIVTLLSNLPMKEPKRMNLFQSYLGASSTVHDRFQEWRSAGVFKRMWIDGLSVYDKKTGIDWKWQAMDGVITIAPLGGKR